MLSDQVKQLNFKLNIFIKFTDSMCHLLGPIRSYLWCNNVTYAILSDVIALLVQYFPTIQTRNLLKYRHYVIGISLAI